MNNSSAEHNTTQCEHSPDDPVLGLLTGIYTLAFVLGLIFNVLTFCPILQQVRSQNILGVFLLNLSISDILYLLTMPMWIKYYHEGHKWTMGRLTCKVAGFLYYSNMYVSIYLLCGISVDRCLAVSFPLRSKSYRSSRCAWLQCLVLCLLVMSAHCLLLLLEDHISTSDLSCYDTYQLPPAIAAFNLFRVGAGFLLPLLVMGLCYWKILSHVNQSEGLKEPAKRKVRLLSFGVIGIFSVCFAPYHLLLATRSLAYFSMNVKQYGDFEKSMHFPFSCMLALSSLNSVLDPVLYVLASDWVRKDMMLGCCRTRQV